MEKEDRIQNLIFELEAANESLSRERNIQNELSGEVDRLESVINDLEQEKGKLQ